SLCTSVIAFGRTRSASRARRSRSRRPPHSTGNSVASAPTRSMISRISRPNTPAPTTSTRSPGSITDSAPASSAVRPEPGMTSTSFLVWNTSRRASVVGSSTPSSNERSYWIAGGWFMAWMTGNGSSVGPGIIRMGRVCTWVQLIVDDTMRSPWRPSAVILASRFHEGRRGAVDEPQVARVHEQAGALAENEDGIAPVDRIRKQGDAAAEREVPERERHHGAPKALRRDPLHEEPRREAGLAEQADRQPDVVRRHPLKRLGRRSPAAPDTRDGRLRAAGDPTR